MPTALKTHILTQIMQCHHNIHFTLKPINPSPYFLTPDMQ